MASRLRRDIVKDLIARDGDRCRYCKIQVRTDTHSYVHFNNDATVDHIIPRSRGGLNGMQNYALACRACNHTKADLSVEQFLAIRAFTETKILARRRRVPRPIQPFDFELLRASVEETCSRPYRPMPYADSMCIMTYGKKAWREMKAAGTVPQVAPPA